LVTVDHAQAHSNTRFLLEFNWGRFRLNIVHLNVIHTPVAVPYSWGIKSEHDYRNASPRRFKLVNNPAAGIGYIANLDFLPIGGRDVAT
jgi:hypothetical protein